ncbi:MAG: hypothetical protein ACHQSE_08205, partial [Gemmatimonadales bacterium]
ASSMFTRMRPLNLVALVATLATTARAQAISLDEGSFTLTRAGARVGREDFSIRRAPGGATLVAHGVVSMGVRRIEPSQITDLNGSVLKYNTTVKEGARDVVIYSGESARDHYRARTSRGAEGESSREFRLPQGMVAVEDDVIHQLWFIAHRGPGATVEVLAPLRNIIERVHVDLVGDERLTIDGRDIDARHLRLRTEGSGATRDVWVDGAGRLLQAAIPAAKIVAVRDDPPR